MVNAFMEYAWNIPVAGRPKQTFVILHNVVSSTYQEIFSAVGRVPFFLYFFFILLATVRVVSRELFSLACEGELKVNKGN